jgi:NAD(P)-dependent dehydrogenase (short-subunit alcohol dehydrogenase family)
MRLKNKVAIITGAAHGMGEAEARLFAAEGAKVIVADLLESDAEIVAADIRAGGGDATATKIDVTSEPEWIDLIANIEASYDRLDILVNNAGISGSSVGDPIDSVPDRLWEAIAADAWRIEHFGISALGELVGWALPESYPPRNNRTSKSLRSLGFPVIAHG